MSDIILTISRAPVIAVTLQGAQIGLDGLAGGAEVTS